MPVGQRWSDEQTNELALKLQSQHTILVTPESFITTNLFTNDDLVIFNSTQKTPAVTSRTSMLDFIVTLVNSVIESIQDDKVKMINPYPSFITITTAGDNLFQDYHDFPISIQSYPQTPQETES
jgi:hypothetical protein